MGWGTAIVEEVWGGQMRSGEGVKIWKVWGRMRIGVLKRIRGLGLALNRYHVV